jgi:hypothetical protein
MADIKTLLNMTENNKAWLHKNCSALLNSKLTDDVLYDKAGLIREAAYKRGISMFEVSDMYQQINREKKNEN